MAHQPDYERNDVPVDSTPMDGVDDHATPMDSEGSGDDGTPVENNGEVPFCGMK
jgi:hypothetical protein